MESQPLTTVPGLPWLPLARFIFAERVITVLTRVFDVLDVALIVQYGPITAFVVVTPLYFAFCGIIVWLSHRSATRGIDLFGIDTLRVLVTADPAGLTRWKRFARWVLQRRTSIFWIGSVFYLDPDFVTLLLRRPGDTLWRTLAMIALPSVVLSQTVWVGVYWLGYQGFTWARWLWEGVCT